MNKISYSFLILALASLACSFSLDKPNANLSADAYSATSTPSPTEAKTIQQPTATSIPITCKVIATEALNLRNSPTIDGKVIAWLVHGEILILSSDPRVDDWVKVTTAEHIIGWVNSKYCEVTQ
jgi:uncharacterized protein YgiM (DUF1202 family)